MSDNHLYFINLVESEAQLSVNHDNDTFLYHDNTQATDTVEENTNLKLEALSLSTTSLYEILGSDTLSELYNLLPSTDNIISTLKFGALATQLYFTPYTVMAPIAFNLAMLGLAQGLEHYYGYEGQFIYKVKDDLLKYHLMSKLSEDAFNLYTHSYGNPASFLAKASALVILPVAANIWTSIIANCYQNIEKTIVNDVIQLDTLGYKDYNTAPLEQIAKSVLIKRSIQESVKTFFKSFDNEYLSSNGSYVGHLIGNTTKDFILSNNKNDITDTALVNTSLTLAKKGVDYSLDFFLNKELSVVQGDREMFDLSSIAFPLNSNIRVFIFSLGNAIVKNMIKSLPADTIEDVKGFIYDKYNQVTSYFS
jgi:hypothetical protein